MTDPSTHPCLREHAITNQLSKTPTSASPDQVSDPSDSSFAEFTIPSRVPSSTSLAMKVVRKGKMRRPKRRNKKAEIELEEMV